MSYYQYKISLRIIAILFFAVNIVQAAEQTTIFQDSFEKYELTKGKKVYTFGKWRQTEKQNVKAEITDSAAQEGKKSILLSDNDPKGNPKLYISIKFPQKGKLSGYLMMPSEHEGISLLTRYTCIRLFSDIYANTTYRGPVIAIGVAPKMCHVQSKAKDDKKLIKRVKLPAEFDLGTWVKWSIEWQWDGKSPNGKFCFSLGDCETEFLPFQAGNGLSTLSFVCGWSTATNAYVYYDSIKVESEK